MQGKLSEGRNRLGFEREQEFGCTGGRGEASRPTQVSVRYDWKPHRFG